MAIKKPAMWLYPIAPTTKFTVEALASKQPGAAGIAEMIEHDAGDDIWGLTVLVDLVKLTREAGAPLPSNEIPFALYNALLHHFGGIRRARRAAKLRDPPQARDWTHPTRLPRFVVCTTMA
jgi:hypothetical protein